MYVTVVQKSYNTENGERVMISKTLDESMAKAKKFENITKASKFGDLFKDIYPEKSAEKEFEMLQKISEYVKKEEEPSFEDAEVLEYITENPDEIAPIFDFNSSVSTGLPFFKSIDYKLSEVFGV